MAGNVIGIYSGKHVWVRQDIESNGQRGKLRGEGQWTNTSSSIHLPAGVLSSKIIVGAALH